MMKTRVRNENASPQQKRASATSALANAPFAQLASVKRTPRGLARLRERTPMANHVASPTQEEHSTQFDAKLRAYARLIVEAGCALKPGQDLFVRAHIESAPLVRLVTQEAYAMGAHHVTVRFSDEAIERMHFDNCPMDVFENVPGWLA